MAFEDRSSPNTATSPSSKTNTASSPESSRTTLKTTNNNIEIKTESIDFNSHNKALKIIENKNPTFLRIASFAVRQCSTLTSEDEQSIDNHDIINDEESLSSFEIASNSNSSNNNNNNNNNNNTNNDNNNSNASNLMFSIQKILQPDFGKCAISKTKKDKISFKPYEDNGNNKTNKPQIPPLGSLCQTVSLLGHSTQTVFNYKKVENSVSKKSQIINDNLEKKTDDNSLLKTSEENKLPTVWPAWVYCTRYSDRPSSGPRSRRMKKNNETPEEKRPRTAFSSAQLARLKHEFAENRYLTEKRRQQLSNELGLNEAQIKIWFQNKRAKIKKSSGNKNPLALQLMAQGLYNHSTIPCDEDDMPLE